MNLTLGVALVVTLALACTGDDGPKTLLSEKAAAGALPAGHPPIEGVGISAAAKTALDSGNAAYRSKDYETALRHYREAARSAPLHASPWFGVYMVAQATSNKVLADSALQEVQKRTVDAPGVTDSTLRGTHAKAPGPST